MKEELEGLKMKFRMELMEFDYAVDGAPCNLEFTVWVIPDGSSKYFNGGINLPGMGFDLIEVVDSMCKSLISIMNLHQELGSDVLTEMGRDSLFPKEITIGEKLRESDDFFPITFKKKL